MKMDELDLEVQLNEISILQAIDHPSIVKLIEYFEDQASLYIVLEYLEG